MKNKLQNSRSGEICLPWMVMATLLALVLTVAACGYRVRGAVGKLPDGAISIAIPVFSNQTAQFRIEQTVTRAVRQEFVARARGRVLDSVANADLELTGAIKEVTAVPVTFGSQNAGEQTFGSAFQITVCIGAKLTRRRDAAVLWENDNFVFRERYLLNARVQDFFAGDNAALERLAHDFAAALVSALLER